MKISCPACEAKYSIADEKVQDRLAKIRCRKCSTTIVIDGKVDPPEVRTGDAPAAPPPESEAGPTEGEYSVDFGDEDQRNMSAAQIVAAYNAGEITADTYVWAEGMADWAPLADVPEISDALHAAAGDQPSDDGAAVAGAAVAGAAAAEPQANLRSGAGRGSATDLFGGIETAGSEEDVATSAPEPVAAAAAQTGQRNESSVLFSLRALTGGSEDANQTGAPAAAAAPADTSDGGDDSGLIDLKALTTVSSEASSADDDHNLLAVGAAPLGMASPLGVVPEPAATMAIPAAPQQQSKAGMIMGALALVIAMVGAGFAMMGGGDKEAEAAAAAASAAAARQAIPERVAEPEPAPVESAAKPPPTGTAADEEPPPEEGKAVATVAPKKKSTWRPKKKSSASTTSSTSSSTSTKTTTKKKKRKKKKKKKKKKRCACKASDLMCQMRCSTK